MKKYLLLLMMLGAGSSYAVDPPLELTKDELDARCASHIEKKPYHTQAQGYPEDVVARCLIGEHIAMVVGPHGNFQNFYRQNKDNDEKYIAQYYYNQKNRVDSAKKATYPADFGWMIRVDRGDCTVDHTKCTLWGESRKDRRDFYNKDRGPTVLSAASWYGDKTVKAPSVSEKDTDSSKEVVVSYYFDCDPEKENEIKSAELATKYCAYRADESTYLKDPEKDQYVTHRITLTRLDNDATPAADLKLFFGGDVTVQGNDHGYFYYDPVLGYTGAYAMVEEKIDDKIKREAGDTFFVLQPSSSDYRYLSDRFWYENPKGIFQQAQTEDLSCTPDRNMVYLGDDFFDETLKQNGVSKTRAEWLGITRPREEAQKPGKHNEKNKITGIDNRAKVDDNADNGLAVQWHVGSLEKNTSKTFYVSQCFDKPCLHTTALIYEFRVLDEEVNHEDFTKAPTEYLKNKPYGIDRSAGELTCTDGTGETLEEGRIDFKPGRQIYCSAEAHGDNKYTFLGWAEVEPETDGYCSNKPKAEEKLCHQGMRLAQPRNCGVGIEESTNNNKIFIPIFSQVKLKLTIGVNEPKGGSIHCFANLPDSNGELKPRALFSEDVGKNGEKIKYEKMHGYGTGIWCDAPEENSGYRFIGWSFQSDVIDEKLRTKLQTSTANPYRLKKDTHLIAVFQRKNQNDVNFYFSYRDPKGDTHSLEDAMRMALECSEGGSTGVLGSLPYTSSVSNETVTCTLHRDKWPSEFSLPEAWKCFKAPGGVVDRDAPCEAECTEKSCGQSAKTSRLFILPLGKNHKVTLHGPVDDFACNVFTNDGPKDIKAEHALNSAYALDGSTAQCTIPAQSELRCSEAGSPTCKEVLKQCKQGDTCSFEVHDDIELSVVKQNSINLKVTAKIVNASGDNIADTLLQTFCTFDEMNVKVGGEHDAPAGLIDCTAEDKPGYRFIGWTHNGAGVSTERNYLGKIKEDSIMQAVYLLTPTTGEPATQQFFVQVNPDGLPREVLEAITCDKAPLGGSIRPQLTGIYSYANYQHGDTKIVCSIAAPYDQHYVFVGVDWTNDVTLINKALPAGSVLKGLDRWTPLNAGTGLEQCSGAECSFIAQKESSFNMPKNYRLNIKAHGGEDKKPIPLPLWWLWLLGLGAPALALYRRR